MANNEMYTPSWLIEKVKMVMGEIDTDPCSCLKANTFVRARRFYTKEENGLKQEWEGNVFINPPYSAGSVLPFIEKLHTEVDRLNIIQAMLLVNAQTAAKWFHRAMSRAKLILFFNKRISFVDGKTMIEKNGNDRSQVLFYYGYDFSEFKRAFEDCGTIVEVISNER